MHRSPHPVPSLDELAQDPKLLDGLPRAARLDLFRIVGRLHVELDAALRTDAPSAAEPPRAPELSRDEPLDVAEAARRLGISHRTLYRRAHTTYAALQIRTGTRSLRFSARAIAAYTGRRPSPG